MYTYAYLTLVLVLYYKYVYVFQSSNLGQELLDRVFKHLNLLETSYFGLRYLDHGNQTVGCNLFYLTTL